jgi:toxin ParE1/3/4
VSRREHTVRLLSPAENDLADILLYIAADNPAAAEKFANTIERRLRGLQKHPYSGRIPADHRIAKMGYRYLVIENYPFFYVVEDAEVFIHRIIHDVRDYKELL